MRLMTALTIVFSFSGVILFSERRAVASPSDLPLASFAEPITCLGVWNKKVWVGTEKGLFECELDLVAQKGVVFPGGKTVKINCLFCGDEKLYIGTNNGLFSLDAPGNSPRITPISTKVFCVIQFAGKLLVCEQNQISVLAGDQIVHRLKNHVVTDLVIEDNGRSCYAAVGRFGCYQLSFKKNELMSNLVCQAHACKALTVHGAYLFCTPQLGARKDHNPERFDLNATNEQKGFSLTMGKSSGEARQFVVHKQKVWMAASDGLFKLTPEDEKLAPPRIKDINVTAMAIHDDQLFFAAKNDVRYFRGMEDAPWEPFGKFHPFCLRFSGYTVEIPANQIDYGERTIHKYATLADQKTVRHNLLDGSFTILDLPVGFHTASIGIEDLNGTKGHREITFFSIPLPLFVVVGVIAGGVIALLHVPILAFFRVADWEVWQMGDAPWVKAIPQTQRKEPKKEKKKGKKSKKGTKKEDWLYSSGAPNAINADKMREELLKSHKRAFRLVAESAPQESTPAADSIVKDYLKMRGEQAPSTDGADFDPLVMAMAFGDTAARKQKYANKPRGKLTFATIGHFDEDNRPEDTEGLGLRWHRWTSMVVHGFRAPRRIIDAIQDRFSGWGGARCIPTREDPDGFFYALQNADVVHVLAHGERDVLVLDKPLSTQDLADFLDKSSTVVRSRLASLVIFSACDVGLSFVEPLVRRGVTVLAARTQLNVQDVLVPFFSSFYLNLFPRRLAQEVTLAEAYHSALKALPIPPYETRRRDQKAQVNSLVLYGDPSLCFRFSLRWPFSKIS